MIDVHCHILPEVDDGPQSWDIAVEMCEIAVRDGITHIVATPHANSQFSYDREQHAQTLQKLRALAPDSLQFSLGCDFHFSYDNIESAIACPDRYTISGSNYLLIELSNYSIPPAMVENMFRLTSATGLKLILTHPERNPILQARPKIILDWIKAGCIVQVTAASLTGFWGKPAIKAAQWLMKHDAVHVLASDAHNSQRRPPIMSEAVKVATEWTNAEVANALVEKNPRAIVAGQDLPYFPDPRK
jgi:protein-tyrosine phosphatase